MKPLCVALIGLLFFVSCSKDEPCDSIVCANDGICVNGSCQCPPNYTGASCLEQQTPAFIRIRKVVVTDFPELNNGNNWDVNSARPDLLLVIRNGQNEILYQHPTYINEALGSINHTFDIFLEISEPKAIYIFQLYDYDGNGPNGGDDFLGGVGGSIYWEDNGFPSIIPKSCANCSVAFEVSIEYVF